MRNIEQHNLFVNTKPGRLFLKAALPGAIGMLASAMYQTLDGVFVGRFLGSTAFAAINLAMPFVIINFSLADLIGVGSSVPISIALGEGRGEDANKIFSLAIVLIFLAGLAIGGLLFFAAPLLIALMGAEGEFASQAVMYMRTYAMLSPFTTMMFASDNFLRICGKIRTSMSLNIFMSLFGATVEFLFLAVFGFGIWAAALANCLAMMTTTMLSMLPFMSKKLALRFVRPHFSLRIIKKIVSCGLPSFLNNIAGRLTSIVMNMMLVRFGGQNAVSVYGVLMYADGIIQPLMYGSCDSLQPAIGYNWGAGQYSRVRKIEKYCFSVAAGLCAMAFLMCTFAPSFIVHAFMSGAAPSYAVFAVHVFAFTYVTRWITFSTQSFMLAIEKSLYATVLSISAALVFPLLFIFSLQGLGLTGIWLNFPLSSFCCALMSLIILMRERKNISRPDLAI